MTMELTLLSSADTRKSGWFAYSWVYFSVTRTLDGHTQLELLDVPFILVVINLLSINSIYFRNSNGRLKFFPVTDHYTPAFSSNHTHTHRGTMFEWLWRHFFSYRTSVALSGINCELCEWIRDRERICAITPTPTFTNNLLLEMHFFVHSLDPLAVKGHRFFEHHTYMFKISWSYNV